MCEPDSLNAYTCEEISPYEEEDIFSIFMEGDYRSKIWKVLKE